MSSGHRKLTPSEKYFAFLDPVSSMNLLLVAHLDRCLPVDLVAERWTAFATRRVTARLQIHGDLTMSDGGVSVTDFVGRELPSSEWDDELAREMSKPFGLDRPMGCRYLYSPDEDRSRLYLTVHHAASDGRGGVVDLQAFLRSLDGQEVPEQTELPVPSLPRAQFRWQKDKRELIEFLRRLRERQDDSGPLSTMDRPPHGTADDVPWVRSLVEDSADLVAGVKRHRTKMFPAIAAAWLSGVSAVAYDTAEPVLQLVTPVDLAVRTHGSDQLVAASVSVLSGRYRVPSNDLWSLARQIQERIAAATRDGEGELFFLLGRIDSTDDIDAGSQLVRRALENAHPSTSVTNLGVIDPGTDPSWVRGVCGFLAPSPNHVVFVSGAGYRGRLVQSVATSPNRLAADSATRVVDVFHRTTQHSTAREVSPA